MKDDFLSKLTVTKNGHQATQCKKIIDALLDFCKDKNYKYIDDIVSTNNKITKAYFLPAYLVKHNGHPRTIWIQDLSIQL